MGVSYETTYEFLSLYKPFEPLSKHNNLLLLNICDWGGEYTSNEFSELLTIDGTIHQTFCTHTSEQGCWKEI